VSPAGVEPATYRLGGGCSIQGGFPIWLTLRNGYNAKKSAGRGKLMFRNKRSLRICLSGLIVLTLISPMYASLAANKASGACPKVGKIATIKTYKYVCQKSGKKLIWVKKVIPTPTPTPTPTPATLPQVLLVEGLLSPISAKLKAADFGTVTDSAEINIDPLLANSQWSKDSVASLNMALKLLKVLGVTPKNKLKLYISWGPDYRNQFTPDYCHSDSGGGSCGNGIIYADLLWFAKNWGYGGVEKPYSGEMTKMGIVANVPHELGHVAQEEFAGAVSNFDYWRYQPAWLREGGAEFIKVTSYAFDNNLTYTYVRNLYAQNIGYECLKHPLAEMAGQGSYSHGCEYSKGFFAAEYLISKIGSIEALYKMGQTKGSDSASVFKEAFGIGQAEFQAEADQYFVSVLQGRK